MEEEKLDKFQIIMIIVWTIIIFSAWGFMAYHGTIPPL